jgi:hypothetical protein
MSDDLFSGPSAMGIDWKSLYGKLLAIFPYGKEFVNTRFGESDAVRADIYNVDEGVLVTPDALVFPRALVLQLGGVDMGRAVLGRLGQGEARGGQSAPWILQDPSPEDYAKARALFEAKPARAMILAKQRAQQPTQASQAQVTWDKPPQNYTTATTPQPQPQYMPPPSAPAAPRPADPWDDRPPF